MGVAAAIIEIHRLSHFDWSLDSTWLLHSCFAMPRPRRDLAMAVSRHDPTPEPESEPEPYKTPPVHCDAERATELMIDFTTKKKPSQNTDRVHLCDCFRCLHTKGGSFVELIFGNMLNAARIWKF